MLQPPGSSSGRRAQQTGKKKTAQTPDAVIRSLQRLAANKRCADCSSRLPSCVNLTIGSFVCITCAGIHRELNQRVKGVGHSSFTEEEATTMKETSNEKVNHLYLATYNPRASKMKQPEDNSDPQFLKRWIRRKYVEKEWYGLKNQANSQQLAQPTVVKIPPKKKSQEEDLLGAPNASIRVHQEWDAFGTNPTSSAVQSNSFHADFGSNGNVPVTHPPDKPAPTLSHFGSSQTGKMPDSHQGGLAFEADFGSFAQQTAQVVPSSGRPANDQGYNAAQQPIDNFVANFEGQSVSSTPSNFQPAFPQGVQPESSTTITQQQPQPTKYGFSETGNSQEDSQWGSQPLPLNGTNSAPFAGSHMVNSSPLNCSAQLPPPLQPSDIATLPPQNKPPEYPTYLTNTGPTLTDSMTNNSKNDSGAKRDTSGSNEKPFVAGQQLFYKSQSYCGPASIVAVHHDDDLVPFYSILVNGKEKQTDRAHLFETNPIMNGIIDVLFQMNPTQLLEVQKLVARLQPIEGSKPASDDPSTNMFPSNTLSNSVDGQDSDPFKGLSLVDPLDSVVPKGQSNQVKALSNGVSATGNLGTPTPSLSTQASSVTPPCTAVTNVGDAAAGTAATNLGSAMASQFHVQAQVSQSVPNQRPQAENKGNPFDMF